MRVCTQKHHTHARTRCPASICLLSKEMAINDLSRRTQQTSSHSKSELSVNLSRHAFVRGRRVAACDFHMLIALALPATRATFLANEGKQRGGYRRRAGRKLARRRIAPLTRPRMLRTGGEAVWQNIGSQDRSAVFMNKNSRKTGDTQRTHNFRVQNFLLQRDSFRVEPSPPVT